MRQREFLLEYVQFSPEKLKARLLQEPGVDKLDSFEMMPSGSDEKKEIMMLDARIKLWTIPGDKRFVRWLERFDPTQNNKYVNWMIRRYIDGGIHGLEDFGSGITQNLERFDLLKRKKKLDPEDADINKLKGSAGLSKLIHKYAEHKLEYDPKDVNVILDSPNYSIIQPKTYKASKALAAGTDWCTAYPDEFANYSKQGPLYIITDKKTNERFQFHFETEQFMDEDDIPLGALRPKVGETNYPVEFLNDHKEVSDVFAKLGKFQIEGDAWIFNDSERQVSVDKEGLYHRDPKAGPARTWNIDGEWNLGLGDEQREEYWVHGKRHREDGPAMRFSRNGIETEHWYLNGEKHRDPEDGPAVTSYLDTDTGEIDPGHYYTQDGEEADGRYERRYDYYVDGEPVKGPATNENYKDKLSNMLELAGVKNVERI